MSETRNIYYITREGRSCKPTGQQAYVDELKIKYDIEVGEAIFYQGEVFNNPNYLIEKLKEDINAIIILSMPEESAYLMNSDIAPDNLSSNVIPLLERGYTEDHKATSWEIIYNDYIAAKTNGNLY